MATKKQTTAIQRWDTKFAEYAKQGVDQIKNIGGGVGLKFGRGTIEVGGVSMPGGKLECIILGSCAHNRWYEGRYDANDKQPPDCYAFAITTDDESMAPHEQAANPQASSCAECPKNEFGSAETGRGKACANTVRIGVITAKDAEDVEGIATAEMAVGGVSPTNLKHWAGYVKMLAEEHGRPTWAAVTEISSYDDPKTQIRVEFKLVELIEDETVLDALEKRFLKVQDALQTPYAAIQKTEKPVRGGAKTASVGRSSKFAGGRR